MPVSTTAWIAASVKSTIAFDDRYELILTPTAFSRTNTPFSLMISRAESIDPIQTVVTSSRKVSLTACPRPCGRSNTPT